MEIDTPKLPMDVELGGISIIYLPGLSSHPIIGDIYEDQSWFWTEEWQAGEEEVNEWYKKIQHDR